MPNEQFDRCAQGYAQRGALTPMGRSVYRIYLPVAWTWSESTFVVLPEGLDCRTSIMLLGERARVSGRTVQWAGGSDRVGQSGAESKTHTLIAKSTDG